MAAAAMYVPGLSKRNHYETLNIPGLGRAGATGHECFADFMMITTTNQSTIQDACLRRAQIFCSNNITFSSSHNVLRKYSSIYYCSAPVLPATLLDHAYPENNNHNF